MDVPRTLFLILPVLLILHHTDHVNAQNTKSNYDTVNSGNDGISKGSDANTATAEIFNSESVKYVEVADIKSDRRNNNYDNAIDTEIESPTNDFQSQSSQAIADINVVSDTESEDEDTDDDDTKINVAAIKQTWIRVTWASDIDNVTTIAPHLRKPYVRRNDTVGSLVDM